MGPLYISMGVGIPIFGLLPFFSKHCATAAFGIVMLSCTLPSYFVAKVGLFFVDRMPEEKKPAGQLALRNFVYRCLNWSWWFTTVFTYWVNIRCEGLPEMRRALNAKVGKPRVLLLNHTSFFDSILGIGMLPNLAIGDMKTLAAEHLFKMPVLGALSLACQHLAVSFKSKGENDFGVDKEKTAEIQRKLDEHVSGGGMGCWYPEGRLHPGTGLELQTFRAGGFGLCVRHDCEIWCMTTLGSQVFWPSKAPLGGQRANIGLKAFCICESSHALAAEAPEMEGTEKDRAQALYLANTAQEKMQAALNEVAASGWCSLKKEKVDKKSD